MFYPFIIALREGIEAALIVAVLLGYLKRTGQAHYSRQIWAGVVLAILVSICAGVVLNVLAAEISGTALELLEGSAMLLAVVILTWVVTWMKRHASSVGNQLRVQADAAMATGSVSALALLSFTAVGREGLETVLLLFAGLWVGQSIFAYWFGAGLGFAIAIGIGAVVYQSALILPLRSFFNVTGVLIILLAAGLLANGLKEIAEAGVLTLGPRVWDTYDFIADNSTLGRFLAAMLGYDSSPALGQVLAYGVYGVTTMTLFLMGREGANRVTSSQDSV